MKILFVCTGNTCRSPMAEAIYNKYSNSNLACSAGLVAGDQEIAENSKIALKEDYDILITSRLSKQFTLDMAKDFDLILTMTKSHKNAIINSYPQLKSKTFVLGEYVDSPIEISDPFGQNIKTYKKCAKEIEELIKLLLERKV